MRLVNIYEITNEQKEAFDCGNKQLNDYFKLFAKQNDAKNLGKTYVGLEGNKIVGYFTLVASLLKYKDIDPIMIRHYPKYPIPCLLIARFAIDEKYKNSGYGAKLLKHIFIKFVTVSDLIGCNFLLVDSKVESLGFNKKFGFESISLNSSTLVIHVDTIIKAIKQATKK